MKISPEASREQVGYALQFTKRVVRVTAAVAGAVCGAAVLLGHDAVALGFGLGALASVVGFWFAFRKSLSLLSASSPKMAPALAFKWFIPRYLLYGAALLVGSRLESVSFPAVVCGVLLCNAMLVLYEPVISRFLPGENSLSEESASVSGKWKT